MHSKLFLYWSGPQKTFNDNKQWLKTIFPLMEPFWKESKNRYRLEPVDLHQDKNGLHSDQTVISFIREHFNNPEQTPKQSDIKPWVRPIFIIDEDAYQRILKEIQTNGECWSYNYTVIDRFIVYDTKGQFHRIVSLDDRGKFDWFEVGGRFTGDLRLKPNCDLRINTQCDALPKRCIDMHAMQFNEKVEALLNGCRRYCQMLEQSLLYSELDTKLCPLPCSTMQREIKLKPLECQKNPALKGRGFQTGDRDEYR